MFEPRLQTWGKDCGHEEALAIDDGARARADALSPADASSLTLAQRVAKLEAKLKCVVRTPVSEFAEFAKYGDPVTGQNFSNVYAGDADTEAPDQLTDLGNAFGLDWDFGAPEPPDFWVLTVKADAEGFVSSTCAKLFPKQVAPAALLRTQSERMVRARQLARVRLASPAVHPRRRGNN